MPIVDFSNRLPGSSTPAYIHPTLYVDYCRAYTIALTGGQVITGGSKNERAAAAMALGATDGVRASHLQGASMKTRAEVEAAVDGLVPPTAPPAASHIFGVAAQPPVA